ncbi:quinone oxidoreductase family protein [Kiloniella antarctica]|uniref:Quinone oxidoreductase family protein n=1 Tax=Kiloniella antarctica TaxID=1550907 RepID=A0ABW5BIQ2_9PROT
MSYAIIARQTGGTDVLKQINLDIPSPKEGEVLIRHTAIGVNFIDTYFRSGLYPWPVEKDLVLGSEAAGVIEQLGEGVSGFTVGDRVAYTLPNGAYVTHRALDAKHLVKLPDDISDEVAAASMLKGLTAHYLLHRSYAPERGQTVLFHAAAGGVGLIAGQWLSAKGVNAIGTAGGPQKCALAAEHGYGHTIDYRSENFVERINEITDGQGVDAVYDSVGKDTYPGSLNCLKIFGSLVNFGQSSGPALDFKLSDLAVGSYSVTRPILFHFTAEPGYLQSASDELFKMITSGKIKININQKFSLSEAVKAHDQLEGRKTTGSTILLPN